MRKLGSWHGPGPGTDLQGTLPPSLRAGAGSAGLLCELPGTRAHGWQGHRCGTTSQSVTSCRRETDQGPGARSLQTRVWMQLEVKVGRRTLDWSRIRAWQEGAGKSSGQPHPWQPHLLETEQQEWVFCAQEGMGLPGPGAVGGSLLASHGHHISGDKAAT